MAAPALVPSTLLASVRGDVLHLRGDGRLVVVAPCGQARAYGCITCGIRLANRGQLELHTDSGTHVVCRLCDLHGAEEWQPDGEPSEGPPMATMTKPAKAPASKKSTKPAAAAMAVPADELRRVPVAQVVPSPYQPRRTFDDAQLAELAASLEASGLLQPITVRTLPDARTYELIAGERRLRAAQRLGWSEISAVVKVMGDSEAAALALVENLQRADLSPLEEAQAYKRLMREHGWSQAELARRTGVSRSSIGDRLGLLDIGPWLELLAGGEITVSHAVELRRYRGAPLGEHQAAIANARRERSGGALVHVDVAIFRSTLPRWYERAMYPLEPSGWDGKPEFDTSAHDVECTCGRTAITNYGDKGRAHCMNPEWWRPLLDDARTAADEAQGDGPTLRSGKAWSDLGVTLVMPEGAETRTWDGWGDPPGLTKLTDTAGRWDWRNDPFDPDDVDWDAIGPDELVVVQNHRTGGHYVATSDVVVIESAQERWEARWKDRAAGLRAEVAGADFTLRGAGVRAYLLDVAYGDDLPFTETLTESDQVPPEVRAEIAEEYPGAVTTAWLRAAPIELLEQLACDQLRRRMTSDRYDDPAALQVRDEKAAAIEEIRARPVPWVTARPALLGDQRDLEEDLPDPADDDEDEEDDWGAGRTESEALWDGADEDEEDLDDAEVEHA